LFLVKCFVFNLPSFILSIISLQNSKLFIFYCNSSAKFLIFSIIGEKLFFTLSLFYSCSD
ncbi:hypothetical protein B4U18_09520, partial [Klebsiella pneumoniae]